MNAEAESYYIDALNIRAEVLGTGHADYATSCYNLGVLYYTYGLYKEAEPLFLEAKNVFAEALGKNNYAYTWACASLAGLYKDQALYDKPSHFILK